MLSFNDAMSMLSIGQTGCVKVWIRDMGREREGEGWGGVYS